MVPVTGLEPVRILLRGILSPLCLPVPSHRRTKGKYTLKAPGCQVFFVLREIPRPWENADRLWENAVGFGGISAGFGGISAGFGGISAGFDGIAAGFGEKRGVFRKGAGVYRGEDRHTGAA